jgi:hypothetical protein
MSARKLRSIWHELPGGIAVPALQPQEIHSKNRRAKRRPAAESTEWVGLWSVSLGLAAVLVAAIAYFAGRDSVGTSLILFGTAAMVALVMRASANPSA